MDARRRASVASSEMKPSLALRRPPCIYEHRAITYILSAVDTSERRQGPESIRFQFILINLREIRRHGHVCMFYGRTLHVLSDHIYITSILNTSSIFQSTTITSRHKILREKINIPICRSNYSKLNTKTK